MIDDYEIEMKEIDVFVRGLCSSVPYNTHHYDHILRVHNLCVKIGQHYPVDFVVLRAAALLHDIGHFSEDFKVCHAEISAQFTVNLLTERHWPKQKIDSISYAVKNHRYSKGVIPVTLEARILQDCDRLEALGAVGITRVLSYDLELPLYDIDRPFKDLEDKAFRINHFYNKILKLKDGMHTDIAKELANERDDFIRGFLKQFKSEI